MEKSKILRLYPYEYEIIKNLIGKELEISELSSIINVPLSTLFSRIEDLKSKDLIKVREESWYMLTLTGEGKLYANEGLPEKRLIEILKGVKKEKIENVKRILGENIFRIAIVNALRKGFIKISNEYIELLNYSSMEEYQNILRELNEKKQIILKEQNQVISELVKRNIIKSKEVKKVFLKISEKAEYYLKNNLVEVLQEKSKLTPEDIIKGYWKNYFLKPYNFDAFPPKIYFGRSHPYIKFLEEVKKILLEMGFEEYDSDYIEPELWNFDILFVPQDHPARDLWSTFRLNLPLVNLDKEIVLKVKTMHEKGEIENSIGWQYEWNEEIASRLILRTHTTTVSMKYLYYNKDKDAKVFCISRVFRHDIPDATHSMEFHQCEGIMVGKDLSFANLLGFLKEFASRLGLEKIKFKPTYFPFTEPSVEGAVYHKNLGWLEALPGGMFRPEILNVLGVKKPVLAWGIGIDRIAMAVLEINDIRELFSKDIEFLRENKYI
ncbi:MAG: phenylalanine--tRNA ligase subunit alpha [Thermoproteota archaeon]|nr:phenylalanine--tRNA ligase subunit alpha [Thermoproteota archaeon]